MGKKTDKALNTAKQLALDSQKAMSSVLSLDRRVKLMTLFVSLNSMVATTDGKFSYEDFERIPIIGTTAKVGRILYEGNEMKKAMERGEIKNLEKQPHADNYAHEYALRIVSRLGLYAAAIGAVSGVVKEVVDIYNKSTDLMFSLLDSENLQKQMEKEKCNTVPEYIHNKVAFIVNDCYKDLLNDIDAEKEGIKAEMQAGLFKDTMHTLAYILGENPKSLKHLSSDVIESLRTLETNSNEKITGYDNGFSAPIKAYVNQLHAGITGMGDLRNRRKEDDEIDDPTTKRRHPDLPLPSVNNASRSEPISGSSPKDETLVPVKNAPLWFLIKENGKEA